MAVEPRLLETLNRQSRSDILKAAAGPRYMGGTMPGVKLWVTADTIGEELLAHLNAVSERDVQKSSAGVTRETYMRRLNDAQECNANRVKVFVKDLKKQKLLFFRVDALVTSEQSGKQVLHKGSCRGRQEAEYLASCGVIADVREVRHHGSDFTGTANTYISIPAEKILRTDGLAAYARFFDRQIRVEAALAKTNFPQAGSVNLADRRDDLDAAFALAAKGIRDRAEIEHLRRHFDETVQARQRGLAARNQPSLPPRFD